MDEKDLMTSKKKEASFNDLRVKRSFFNDLREKRSFFQQKKGNYVV